MRRSSADGSLLVLGDAEQAAPIAAELRVGGCRVVVASTLSELRELLAGGLRATLLIVDARTAPPWRVDALERMTAIACSSTLPMLCIGELPAVDGASSPVQRLPADAAVSVIVGAARALHDGHAPRALPRPPSHPDQADV